MTVLLVAAFIWVEAKRALIKSEPYKIALAFIKSDAGVRGEFGEIHQVGFPGGSIESDSAVFKVKIRGSTKSDRIQIVLRNTEFGVWSVESWRKE